MTSRAGIIREWIIPFVSSTLKSFEKLRSPLFGATGNFKHQILPYAILMLPVLDSVGNIFPLCSLEAINIYKIVFACLSKLVLYFYQT